MRAFFLFTVLLSACTCPTDPEQTSSTMCEACLASGGTWQPEASECTADCDLMDISCFRDECPGDCAVDSCGDCFSDTECAAIGCEWVVVAESAWCQSRS